MNCPLWWHTQKTNRKQTWKTGKPSRGVMTKGWVHLIGYCFLPVFYYSIGDNINKQKQNQIIWFNLVAGVIPVIRFYPKKWRNVGAFWLDKSCPHTFWYAFWWPFFSHDSSMENSSEIDKTYVPPMRNLYKMARVRDRLNYLTNLMLKILFNKTNLNCHLV